MSESLHVKLETSGTIEETKWPNDTWLQVTAKVPSDAFKKGDHVRVTVEKSR